MTRCSAEIAAEALRRADKLRATVRSRLGAVSGAAAACLMIAVCLSSFIRYGGAGPPVTESARASLLLSGGAGGYVLVGVVCFAAGVTVTLLCVQAAKKNGNDKEN